MPGALVEIVNGPNGSSYKVKAYRSGHLVEARDEPPHSPGMLEWLISPIFSVINRLLFRGAWTVTVHPQPSTLSNLRAIATYRLPTKDLAMQRLKSLVDEVRSGSLRGTDL